MLRRSHLMDFTTYVSAVASLKKRVSFDYSKLHLDVAYQIARGSMECGKSSGKCLSV